MFAYALASKPCSEATNMLYLSSGVLLVGSSENQLEGFGEEDRRCRSSGKWNSIGLSFEEKAFFDILKSVATKYEFIENFPDETLTELAKQIKTMVEEQSDVSDWLNRPDLRATLKMNVIVLLARAGYPPKIRDEVFKEILEQAESFKRHSRPRPYAIDYDSYSSMVAEP